jgi:membrane-bound lytic murein transglycosylase F
MRFLPLALLVLGCARPAPPPAPAPEPEVAPPDREVARALVGDRSFTSTDDLDEIKRRGVLRVITRNDSTSYFLHRGDEAGFQYELAKLLASQLGVRLDVVVPRATRDMIPWLLQGRGDLIVTSLGPESPRADRAAWTRPYLETDLAVVVKRGEFRPRTLAELKGRNVGVRPSSTAYVRVRELLKDQQLDVTLAAVRESIEPEDLLDLVAEGAHEAAIVPGQTARTELLFRDDLHLAFSLEGPPVTSSLGVRTDNPKLLEAADAFVRKHRRGKLYNILYRRYFEANSRNLEAHANITRADEGAALTPWDPVFRRAAHATGLDWRLLAAVAMQESRLEPTARSHMGALGLMQLIPSTARLVGVDDPLDPEQSIEGGARYLAQVMAAYDDPGLPLPVRVRLGLASYNAGPGHVIDARALAKKRGLDPDKWFDNVEDAIVLLERPRFYREARAGYCRGRETAAYVAAVQTRFDAYVKLTDPKAHPALDP